MQRYGFWDNINRTHYMGQSLYQVTQLNTWLAYQVLGTSKLGWHILFVTLHALNATLLFRLVAGLLRDSGVEKAERISLTGVILFSVTPALSEVVVWEPSFHFLQGFLFLLLTLTQTREYLLSGKAKHAIWAVFIFLLSTFSLEIFYVTPWLAGSLVLFYWLGDKRQYCSRAISFIFLPLLALFCLHLVLFHSVYGGWVAHIGANPVAQSLQLGLGKPLKLLFHILMLGRFFSLDARQSVYAFCDSGVGIGLFYGIVLVKLAVLFYRYKSLSGRARVTTLLFCWSLVTLALLIPLWFDNMFLVVYDRYTYFTNGFLFVSLGILLSYISLAAVRMAVTGLYLLLNVRYAVQVSRYWMKSAHVIEGLLTSFPHETNKTVILLNLPQNMHGIPMIGAEKDSEFKLMHDLLLPSKKIKSPVYDAMAYNMVTPNDGAHIKVINDSTIGVTLNQWGTWWWFAMQGGGSYQNACYRINMKDMGHYYELTLRGKPENYLLLFQAGSQWKTVDLTSKTEQY